MKLGRLQIFNNWSPYLAADKDTVWIGLEYFCNEGDELWEMTDADFIASAIAELVKIDIIKKDDVLDVTILRVPKTYPAYWIQRPNREARGLPNRTHGCRIGDPIFHQF